MDDDFAVVVKRHMDGQGLTLRALARQLPYDPGNLSRILRGKKACPADLAARLDEVLGSGSAITDAAALPLSGAAPGPVPLLLPGDASPARELLGHLRSVGDMDNLFGPRRLLRHVREHIALIEELRKDVTGADGRELLGVLARYSETLAWLHQDMADWKAADYWLDRSLQWAHMCGDMQLAAFSLARKSQLAGDMRDPVAAVDLADAARRLAGGGLLAVGASYQAHGYALAGNEAASLSALDTAREIASALEDDPEAPWAPWLGPGYVDMHQARCQTVFGHHGRAVPLFERALAGISPALRRDRGVCLARQSLAQARAGDTDGAAATGMTALSVLTLTGSGRIAADLRDLDTTLRRRKAHPEFGRALAAALPS
jgi:hypothetical protein